MQGDAGVREFNAEWLFDHGWPWALYVGDKIVTSYRTKQEAKGAIDWYVSCYGSPGEELTVRDLREGSVQHG